MCKNICHGAPHKDRSSVATKVDACDSDILIALVGKVAGATAM